MIAPVIDYNVPNVGSTKVQKVWKSKGSLFKWSFHQVIKIPPSLFSIRYSEIAADEASSNLWRGKTFPSALEVGLISFFIRENLFPGNKIVV